MTDSCASNFDLNSVPLQRGCFTKKHILLDLLGQFVTVWKNQTGHKKHDQLLYKIE